MDTLRAKGKPLVADGAYGVSPLRTLYKYYRLSEIVKESCPPKKEFNMEHLEMEVKIDLRYNDPNGPLLLDTDSGFPAEHPLGSKGILSQEIRDKMKTLSATDRYIDDPHWTTERGLALLKSVEELYFRLLLSEARICYLERKLTESSVRPVVPGLGKLFLEVDVKQEEAAEADLPTVIG